jgi:hypothetical protein
MTDYSDFQAQILDWTNRQDFSPVLVTSFIRQAEEIFNRELRVDRMINTATNTVTVRCSMLPDDWLEMDHISIANNNGPNGWLPIRYMPRDQFFNTVDKRAYGYYTIEGREVTFGGSPDDVDGIMYQIQYYGEVPVFSDTCPSWVYTKYPTVYLNAAQYRAALHAVGEEQTAANFKGMLDEGIKKLNDEHLKSKASGSRLKRTQRRSFG